MMILEFLKDRLKRLLLWVITIALTAAFLRITGTQSGILLILFLVWFLIFSVVLVFDFLRYHTHIKKLEAIMDGLDQKHLFAEFLPKPKNSYERRLFTLMGQSGKSMIESVSDALASQQEYREYIESWVHEIKTPLTAAKLLCRNADPNLGRKITCELSQIDNYVERTLFYARAESPEKDFVIRQANLSVIASQAILNHRSLLIQNGVRIETQDLDCTVYTDSKWTCFILGQLLQNSVRYRDKDPVITLSVMKLGRQVQLTIRDNGIGIPPHELPRVFERGFTGSNGRLRGGSTGIGLYLCRKLSAFMQMNLQIKSVEGQGTKIILTFPSKENLSKM